MDPAPGRRPWGILRHEDRMIPGKLSLGFAALCPLPVLPVGSLPRPWFSPKASRTPRVLPEPAWQVPLAAGSAELSEALL